jgi:lysosomal alpha-mannosidase
VTTYSGLAQDLPTNVEVMTLMKWNDGTVLLRLAHQVAIGEDAKLSGPVTVDLNSLFQAFTVTSIQELSLTANEDKQVCIHRMYTGM